MRTNPAQPKAPRRARLDRRARAIPRRAFLSTSIAGALGAPLLLRSGTLRASPNGMLQHACIGVTRMGGNDLKNFRAHDRVRIVALCDVDRLHLDQAAQLVPDARRYADWRELFEEEGDRIDSVNVTTPDHMHFAIAHRALELGKHVYCQKPMCHDIAEVRLLARTAAAQGRVTQLGTQHASAMGDRTTVHYLREGAIGKARHVYLCSNRAAPNRLEGPRPPGGQQPPPHLAWDLWIGTAPMRPYLPDIYHPATWRGWQDFATSWVADMGCHILDATWRGLGLEAPLDVSAEVEHSWKETPARRADNWPTSEHVTWTFPGNERIDGDRLTVEWFDGAFLPPPEARAYKLTERYPLQAALVMGTEGALLQEVGAGPILLPRDRFRGHPRPKLAPRDHYRHYVDACLGGENTESDLARTAPMTEAILLGSVALREPDQRLEWDPGGMRIPNRPEAERHLRRRYRAGWNAGGF